MSQSEATITCGNADCKVSETGTCIDGHTVPASCPLYGRKPPSSDETTIDEVTEPSLSPLAERIEKPGLVRVARGEALNLREMGALLSERPARIISIVGPVDAGKTSLIACAFDLFQSAAMANLRFAGSATLLGFERICHLARASSEAPEVTGERTTVDSDPFFFHLGVQDGGIRRDLLFADRSGELYEGVSDQPSRADQLIELSQCSVLTLLIDGAGLCSPTRRHAVISEARQFLSSIFERGALSRDAHLLIVLSKIDLVEASGEADALRSAFDAFFEEAYAAYQSRVAGMQAMKVAASPAGPGTPRGFGVNALLRIWLAGGDLGEHLADSQLRRASRTMCRFGAQGDGE